MTYNGVGLKWCSANTSAKLLSVFSPPLRFEIFFQLFFGGMTLNKIPSEKGSRLSTSSSSALPPIVIIWYISFKRNEMVLKPVMKPSRRSERRSSCRFLAASRALREVIRSVVRAACSSTRRRYSVRTERSTETDCVRSSSVAMALLRRGLSRSASSSLV